jgi:hypothetical protein
MTDRFLWCGGRSRGNYNVTEGTTNVAGIEIPSTDPIFLAVVGAHILLGGHFGNHLLEYFDMLAGQSWLVEKPVMFPPGVRWQLT